MNGNTISVIIPVKNDENRIANCLRAIFSQTLPPFEVIVVDGRSTDGTVPRSQEYPVRVIFEDYGTVGGARQVGVEHAEGEFVAFTDSDCIPDMKWLEMLMKEFRPGLAGVGGAIINIGDGIWEKSISLALNSFLGSANSVQDHVLADKKIVRSLSGCNSSYRKSDIEKAGGFDVNLRFNEDTDLNNRIAAYGSLLYTPEAAVIHDQSRGLRQFAKRMFLFGEGRARSRIFDLQVLPPLSLAFILPSAFLLPQLFAFFMILYSMILLSFSLSISLKSKKLEYLFTVPVIFLIEHMMYSLGFWYGTIESFVK